MLSDQHRILVLIETEKDHPIPLDFELLRAGRDLANKSGGKLSACIIGSGLHDLCEELSCYADEVIALDNPRFRDFEANLWASVLTRLCEDAKPITIIMGHTYDSMELAPKLAFRTGGDLITDCVHLERDEKGDHLLCTKPVYGGNAVAVIQTERKPEMVTLRSKLWHPLQKGESKGHIVSFDSKPEQFTAPTESVEMIPEESVNLDKADAIVSAGRGVKSAEGVQELNVLLKALQNYFHHVEIGASRPLVDEGIMPRSRQIGQTGEKVASQVYIALAISGAAQHMAGITACKKVVAINKDPDASIFEGANYGVVASYQDVLPGFIKKLEEMQ
jgi:electron transfer flavoprotein alpha subunit